MRLHTPLLSVVMVIAALLIASNCKAEALLHAGKIPRNGTPAMIDIHETEAALERAYILIAENRFRVAEAVLKSARNADPINHWIALNLGLIYLSTGRPVLAELEYQKVWNASIPAERFFAVLLDNDFDNTPQKKSPAARRHLAKMRNAWNMTSTSSIANTQTEGELNDQPGAPAETHPKSNTSLNMTATVADRCTLRTAIEHIGEWASAWRTRNIEQYLASYSPEFRGALNSPAAWQIERRRTISASKQIELELSDLSVSIENSTCQATATFQQRYRSTNFSDSGIKTLHIVRRGDRWVINRETFTHTRASSATDR